MDFNHIQDRFLAVPYLTSKNKQVKFDFTKQEDSRLKWKLGQSALTYTGAMFRKCNLCGSAYQSFEMKVVHNVKGYDYFIELYPGKSEVVNHMIVCGNCRNKIPRGWFGCKCKKLRR